MEKAKGKPPGVGAYEGFIVHKMCQACFWCAVRKKPIELTIILQIIDI